MTEHHGARAGRSGGNGGRRQSGSGRDAHTEHVVRRMVSEEPAGDARTRTSAAQDRRDAVDGAPGPLARELRAQTTALDGLTAMMRDLKHDLRMVKVDLDKQRVTMERLLHERDARGDGNV